MPEDLLRHAIICFWAHERDQYLSYAIERDRKLEDVRITEDAMRERLRCLLCISGRSLAEFVSALALLCNSEVWFGMYLGFFGGKSKTKCSGRNRISNGHPRGPTSAQKKVNHKEQPRAAAGMNETQNQLIQKRDVYASARDGVAAKDTSGMHSTTLTWRIRQSII